MEIKIGTRVKSKDKNNIYIKDNLNVFIVIDVCKIIDEDGTWHHGVLYSHIDGTTLLVTTKKNFENNFQVIKQ